MRRVSDIRKRYFRISENIDVSHTIYRKFSVIYILELSGTMPKTGAASDKMTYYGKQ